MNSLFVAAAGSDGSNASDPGPGLADVTEGADAADAAHSEPSASLATAEPAPVSQLDSAIDVPGLKALGPIESRRKAREWALVLQSMNVWHLSRYAQHGWFLLVRDEDYARAAGSIDRYEVENKNWPPPAVPKQPEHPRSFIAPITFIGLIAFFVVTGSLSGHSRWFQHGASITDLVLSHEPWRAVTALTLHADGEHVLGNAISGAIFGSAVNRRLGAGGGMLAILAAGTAGNVANALWHHSMGNPGHGSIGASTAVFGAIGLLAATQMVLDRPARAPVRRSWLDIARPIAGGLALLGALGASPSSDLGAHLFGFLSGVVLGLFALGPSKLLRKPLAEGEPAPAVSFGDGPRRLWLQTTLGAIATGIVGGCWVLAMR